MGITNMVHTIVDKSFLTVHVLFEFLLQEVVRLKYLYNIAVPFFDIDIYFEIQS